METAGGEFTQAVQSYHKVWLPARSIVKEALDRRKEVGLTAHTPDQLACTYVRTRVMQ